MRLVRKLIGIAAPLALISSLMITPFGCVSRVREPILDFFAPGTTVGAAWVSRPFTALPRDLAPAVRWAASQPSIGWAVENITTTHTGNIAFKLRSVHGESGLVTFIPADEWHGDREPHTITVNIKLGIFGDAGGSQRIAGNTRLGRLIVDRLIALHKRDAPATAPDTPAP